MSAERSSSSVSIRYFVSEPGKLFEIPNGAPMIDSPLPSSAPVRAESDTLIAEAEGLCNAATPGPWVRGPVEGHEWTRKEILCQHGAQALPWRILFTPNQWFESDADVDFVARARTLIPELTAHLRAAEGKVATAEAERRARGAALRSAAAQLGVADRDDWPAMLAAISALQQRLRAAEQAAKEAERRCVWTLDELDGFYATGCGRTFWFDSGTPSENGARFCHHCGATLEVAASQPEETGR